VGWTLSTAALFDSGIVIFLAWVPVSLRVRNPLVDLRVACPTGFADGEPLRGAHRVSLYSSLLVTTQLLKAPVEAGHGLGRDIVSTAICRRLRPRWGGFGTGQSADVSMG